MKFLDNLLTSLGVASQPALQEIDAPTAREWLSRGRCQLIDVREELEYRAERIPGACLAPLSRLEQTLPKLSPGAKAVFLCRSGARTRMNASRLARCGFAEAYILKGGLMAWRNHGFPTERG